MQEKHVLLVAHPDQLLTLFPNLAAAVEGSHCAVNPPQKDLYDYIDTLLGKLEVTHAEAAAAGLPMDAFQLYEQYLSMGGGGGDATSCFPPDSPPCFPPGSPPSFAAPGSPPPPPSGHAEGRMFGAPPGRPEAHHMGAIDDGVPGFDSAPGRMYALGEYGSERVHGGLNADLDDSIGACDHVAAICL